MPDSLRIIIEPTATCGAWNMAVDEVLLETVLAGGAATLRWYRWSEPTLSLGYFQAADDPAIDERFAGLPRVRRLSGGGAILHDQEWTYSLAVGPAHPLSTTPSQLYRLIHEAVANVLHEFELPAQRRGVADKSLDHQFLCFSRGDANDVVLGPPVATGLSRGQAPIRGDGDREGSSTTRFHEMLPDPSASRRHKVLGSAQRRRRGAVLQHGALLLRASAHAPEFPGILDFRADETDEHRLFDRLTARTAEVVSAAPEVGQLADRERSRAIELQPRQQL